MTFGVVIFPGSNCDEDIIYVLQKILKQTVIKLWHKDTDLKGVDFIIIPGGFSYGDYLRSGAIARFSPIMQEIIKFANNGGFVLGIVMDFKYCVKLNYYREHSQEMKNTTLFVRMYLLSHNTI